MVFLLPLFAVSCLLQDAAPAAVRDESFPAATAQEVGLDPAALEALAAEVEGWIDSRNVVGASLLVIKDRRTVLADAWGLADLEHEVPMRVDTVCNIRSMTKVLTGMAIQQLIDEGLLSPDDHAADFLEAFAHEPYDAITVRMLLEHRSGLALSALRQNTREHDSLYDLAEAATSLPLVADPGEKFWYSDAGTEVLGALVEEVSGQNLDEYIAENILEPLGMSESFYDLDPDDPRREGIASGYMGGKGRWARFWSPEDLPLYPFAWGSQSLYSTPRDYARLMACWMDGGRCGEREVFTEAAVQRALSPRSPLTTMGSDTRMPCGFLGYEAWYGQMAVTWCRPGGEAPVLAVGHSGSDGTAAWTFPAHDLIALCFTQTRGRAEILNLEPYLQRLVEPELFCDFPEEWREFLGPYAADFGTLRNAEFLMRELNGRMAVDLGGNGLFSLGEPDAEGRFRISSGPDFAFAFARDEAGAIESLTFFGEGREYTCPRGKALPEPDLEPQAVAAFLGTYLTPDPTKTVEITLTEGRMMVKFPGEPMAYDLMPTNNPNGWSLAPNPSVKLRFDRDEDGKVVSVTIGTAAGGTEVLPKKDSGDEAEEAGGGGR